MDISTRCFAPVAANGTGYAPHNKLWRTIWLAGLSKSTPTPNAEINDDHLILIYLMSAIAWFNFH
jgi:hypothetical protein